MIRPTPSKAEGCVFESGLAPLNLCAFYGIHLYEVYVEITYELFGEENHLVETCIPLQNN